MKTIKMSTGVYSDPVAWKPQGNTVQGIWLRSHSPMDCFDSKADIEFKKAKVVEKLERMGLIPVISDSGNRLIVEETSRTELHLVLSTVEAPADIKSARLNNGYFNTYLTKRFEKVKKEA